MSSSALIGATGFVGATLRSQRSFDAAYDSKNIGTIRGNAFDLVVCCGAPAAKWIANREPEADKQNLERLASDLRGVRAERFILISTIDVYPVPRGVNEDTPIPADQAEAYGRHRYWLEGVVREQFPEAFIVRLPALFGAGLKKNFVFDLLHNREALPVTHADSRFQFYDMARLWRDVVTVMASGVRLLNICSEPLRAADVALHCAGETFTNQTTKPPVSYDVQTRHARVLQGSGSYHFSAPQTFAALKAFIEQERTRG